MSKPPSEATLLRQARSRIRFLEKQLEAQKDQAAVYRMRATKAETEAAEWKTRFDVLLRRDPPQVEVTGKTFAPLIPSRTI